MKKKKTIKKIIWVTVSVTVLLFFIRWTNYEKLHIKHIQLSSPGNYAFQEAIKVELNQPATIFVRYWKENSKKRLRTTTTKKKKAHTIQLLLLETDVTYRYQIVIDGFFDRKSKELSFHTRKQSPWLVHNWIRKEQPHDAAALGDGLIMLCYSRLPGYIAMIDGKGIIRWYWQVDDIGVRAATLTPHGTILALLRPPKPDVIDDMPKENKAIIQEIQKPMRRGRMGFVGGTELAEIDLTGKTLWRMNLKEKGLGPMQIHHDIRMDKHHRIHTLFRTNHMLNIDAKTDTLGGDGIIVLDTLGNKLWEWNAWDVWDCGKDPYLKRFGYDRFHMNALNFDSDGNYLVSVAIEDQIWKVDAHTGDLMWKFGKNGDFKMDSTYYFSFQHAVHINSEGDLMLFNNSLSQKRSGALSFYMDTIRMEASLRIAAPLPKDKYTSRMGNAILIPNGNLLQTSSKTGTVLITNREGGVLWELTAHFVPYRSEYIPTRLWKDYFVRE